MPYFKNSLDFSNWLNQESFRVGDECARRFDMDLSISKILTDRELEEIMNRISKVDIKIDISKYPKIKLY